MHAKPRTNAAQRQKWATPQAFVRGIEVLTGLSIDVDLCAEEWSAKAPVYLGPGSPVAEDAFTVKWGDFWRVGWCNMPFDSIGDWTAEALREAHRAGFITLGVTPDRSDAAWWHDLLRNPDEPAYMTFIEGRVAFEPPPGIKASSPMGGVTFWQIGGDEPLLPLCVHRDRIMRAGFIPPPKSPKGKSKPKGRRRISFGLTEPQFLDGSKDVTRRMGWLKVKAGDRLLAVNKVMGFRKGETATAFGEIEVVSVRREPLHTITQEDVTREGFPDLTPAEFVAFFCRAQKSCKPDSEVTRIEFRRMT